MDGVADPWLDALLPGARHLVIVPLTAEGQSFGAWVGEHPGRLGSRIERRVVGMTERFVSYGSLALRNAWLHEQVRRAAATDGLTGVSNRASFDETLRKELARGMRRQEDVSLLPGVLPAGEGDDAGLGPDRPHGRLGLLEQLVAVNHYEDRAAEASGDLAEDAGLPGPGRLYQQGSLPARLLCLEDGTEGSLLMGPEGR